MCVKVTYGVNDVVSRNRNHIQQISPLADSIDCLFYAKWPLRVRQELEDSYSVRLVVSRDSSHDPAAGFVHCLSRGGNGVLEQGIVKTVF